MSCHALLPFALGALALVVDCNMPTPPQEFVIGVDSISGPTAVSGGAPFELRLWGTIGPDECHSLIAVRTTRADARLDVTAIGQSFTRGGGLCRPLRQEMRGAVLRVDPPVPDPFTVIVHQPDGSTLTRTIRAE